MARDCQVKGSARCWLSVDRLDRTTHGFAVADKQIQIPFATWDLGDCPNSDDSAQRRDIHLLEEVAENGI
jgi:hypothetical protein